MWLYTEASLRRRHGDVEVADAEDEVAATVRSLTTACTVDLFDALPGLYELVTSPDSCIDAFHGLAGPVEPYSMGPLYIYSGKVLVRKVASLWHAALANPASTVVLWLDMDVQVFPEFFKGEGSALFWNWMAQNDVTYLPFRMPAHLFMPEAELAREVFKKPILQIDDFTWNTDTGAHAVLAGPRALALLRELMDHYDGGAVRMAKHCLCTPHAPFSYTQWGATSREGKHNGDHAHSHRGKRSVLTTLPCGVMGFGFNLYLDDLFVWTLFVQAAGRAQNNSDTWNPAPGLTHGWFASGNTGHPRGDKCLSPWRHVPMQAFACPATRENVDNGLASPLASPFDCSRMFLHHLGSYGAYNQAYKNMSVISRSKSY